MRYQVTTFPTFCEFYARAREADERIRAATSPIAELPATAAYYVAPDHESGYGVSRSGELIAVWSRVPGRGAVLVHDACWRGAEWLSCFDGYLRTFYERAGFYVEHEELNWTPGGPVVLHMRLPATEASIRQHYATLAREGL